MNTADVVFACITVGAITGVIGFIIGLEADWRDHRRECLTWRERMREQGKEPADPASILGTREDLTSGLGNGGGE